MPSSIESCDGLILREVAITDVDRLLVFENANRLFFEDWVPPRAAEFFDRSYQARRLQQLANDPMTRNSIAVAESGTIVGRINLSFRTTDEGLVAEMGYRVAQGMTGKGIATWMVMESIAQIPKEHRLYAVEADAMAENRGSTRVLLKAGLTPVDGVVRSAVLNGQDISLQRFRMLLR